MTTPRRIGARFSPRYDVENAGMAIATMLAEHLDRTKLARGVEGTAPRMLSPQRESGAAELVLAYEAFFKRFGLTCPLGRQIRTTKERGLPEIDPVVRAMLLVEVGTGVLMGAHDVDAIHGGIVFDLALEGESFEGMRATIKCRRGEIVARDDDGIIFSYLQGADRRTCINEGTRNVVYFAFGAPSIGRERLQDALSDLASIVGDAGMVSPISIHAPTGSDKQQARSVKVETCLDPTCDKTAQFQLIRTYPAAPAIVLSSCRDHTDRFHELVLAVKYGGAVSATVRRIEDLQSEVRHKNV